MSEAMCAPLKRARSSHRPHFAVQAMLAVENLNLCWGHEGHYP